MLIPFSTIVKKHPVNIRGIVHVGAHIGQEVPDYRAHGISRMLLIEPCSKQFEQLVQKYGETTGIDLLKVACGADNGLAEMHVETHNGGQSNSILKPGTHLKHYPMIKFDSTETVELKPLRDIQKDFPLYNFLNIDVQGFELEVLKGADITQFDIIYTEVNSEDVYEGAPKIEEIDKYLSSHFVRVETVWTNQGWGDALYVRKENRYNVPHLFRPASTINYPPDNTVPFEQYFASLPVKGVSRTYLPIMWTSYMHLSMRRPLSSAHHLKTLQDFVDSIPREVDGVKQKYFTICQHDDGPSVDFKDLDIFVFGMGGGQMNYTLPLVCAPHRVTHPRMERLIVSSFVGSITHSVRSRMMAAFKMDGSQLHFLTTKPHGINFYCGMMQQSVFALCPRGYGPTSFRIAEALQYGAIPVYIYDREPLIPMLPTSINDYCIMVNENELESLPKKLVEASKDEPYLKFLRDNGQQVYNSYFKFEPLRQFILSVLKHGHA